MEPQDGEAAGQERDPSRESDDLTVERGVLSGASPSPGPVSILAPRLLRRARQRRLAVTGGVILLALAVLFSASPALRVSLLGVFAPQPTAAPTAPLLPGQDQIYLDAEVPWTTVTLDGHRLALPQIGRDPPLRLAHGSHRLVWRAGPFQPQSCTLMVPPQPGDTCPVDLNIAGLPVQPPQPTSTAPPTVEPFARILQLRESLATLPPDQAMALESAMRQSVAAIETTVQPGERYLAGSSGVAAQPLRATFTFTLTVTGDLHAGIGPLSCWLDGTSSSDCVLAGHDCVTLCSIPWQSRTGVPLAVSTWLAFAPALPTWSYSTQDGRVLAQGQPLDRGVSGNVDLLTQFGISWDGAHWHARPLASPDAPSVADDSGNPIIPPACVPVQDFLQDSFLYFIQVHYISAANPAQGCLAIATINPTTASPALAHLLAGGTTTAQFLGRFGVLIPLDAAARTIAWGWSSDRRRAQPGAPARSISRRHLHPAWGHRLLGRDTHARHAAASLVTWSAISIQQPQMLWHGLHSVRLVGMPYTRPVTANQTAFAPGPTKMMGAKPGCGSATNVSMSASPVVEAGTGSVKIGARVSKLTMARKVGIGFVPLSGPAANTSPRTRTRSRPSLLSSPSAALSAQGMPPPWRPRIGVPPPPTNWPVTGAIV
jgi:hypothetical protein